MFNGIEKEMLKVDQRWKIKSQFVFHTYKKNWMEILELKGIIIELKECIDKFNRRLGTAEERISEL